MDAIGSILPKVLRRRGLHLQADASQITYRADAWLQKTLPTLSAMIRARSLRNAILLIECDHSTVAQECAPLLQPLKSYLQREFPAIAIEEVRLVRGRK